ncbi:2-oxoglutarate dehydrogenase E1 component [Lewinellaceae bacterium SD302]|nr:2-oxoglutarate dehydrogenase E1 component [Lewinellaceae bacterium SD302]
MSDFSHIANAHPEYIEGLYQQYAEDPQSVEESWRDFFLGFDYGHQNGNGTVTSTPSPNKGDHELDFEHLAKELRVLALIKAYRMRGHMDAHVDPVGEFVDPDSKLDLSDFDLDGTDPDTVFYSAKEIGMAPSSLRAIVDNLQRIYCSSIGFEYHYMADRTKRRWLRSRIEGSHPEKAYGLGLDKKRRILEKLNGAVGFEDFLKKKYIAQKRFGLEGGEATIVGLDAIITKATNSGAKEIVIGMAHRGRLNVLTNIMGKTYDTIFSEFEGVVPNEVQGDGDVKYHLGYSSIVETPGGERVHLKLVPNPSHLEAVGPVVEGFARAKADMLYDNDYDQILPLLLHGDAAVAGQGVVYETVQMSELDGYTTGGTIHVVINNQVGFTTDYEDARSSLYATGAANVVDAPIFHVNGDDPEAVVFACELAYEFRQEFNQDVFIDIFCYRKHGHNEGDDPAYTQPGLYDRIKKHDDPRKIYTDRLVERGDLERKLAEEMETQFNEHLQERFDEVKQNKLEYKYQEPEQAWRELDRGARTNEHFAQSPETGISEDEMNGILDHLTDIPDDFQPINKVGRLFKNFKKMREEDRLDWAAGELSAYASMLLDQHDIRFSGQDVRRGTFSHRHAVLNGKEGKKTYNRLNGMTEKQGKLHIFNSLLSEFAVLGFEYGYSMSSPKNMVIWEAQFGDFANGASTMFDQFISAGESKWQRMSGLTVLLPHGYEGQGPEHSSARPERFLQLCAEYNMVVANTTTPANFFHLLRRQMAWNWRMPLIHMSPKSLLRAPEATSKIADFGEGTRFQEIIDDPSVSTRGNKKIKTLLLCSGKIYYNLAAKKAEDKRDDVAIVRFEQLYPLPYEQVRKLLKRYSDAEVIWVQEEPRNYGYWSFMSEQFLYNEEMGVHKQLRYVGRKAAASPATGFKFVHEREQKELVDKAFGA